MIVELSMQKNYKQVYSLLDYSSHYLQLTFFLPNTTVIGSSKKAFVIRSGQIEFNEFKSLIDEVWKWKDAFDYFDSDHSGSIDFQELQKTLSHIGY